jgi:hypothetical protein
VYLCIASANHHSESCRSSRRIDVCSYFSHLSSLCASFISSQVPIQTTLKPIYTLLNGDRSRALKEAVSQYIASAANSMQQSNANANGNGNGNPMSTPKSLLHSLHSSVTAGHTEL